MQLEPCYVSAGENETDKRIKMKLRLFIRKADEYTKTSPCLCLSLLRPTVDSSSNPVG